MPATSRRQRARRNEVTYSSPTVKKSRAHSRRVLPDGSVVHVTASNTGKGKHWRWVYPETDEIAASMTGTSSSTSTESVKDYTQGGRFVTPISSVQRISPSIQNAPRRREKHHPRPTSAPTPVQRLVAPENTIPWEKELETPKHGSSSVCPGRPALGPHGTWLVDDEGNYIVIPVERSSQVHHVNESKKDSAK